MRSLLYVPANSPRFIDKAHLRGADCIILDLEDSVPTSEKEQARAALRDSVVAVRRGMARIAVRINSGMHDDVAAAVAAGSDLIVAPKLGSPVDVDALAAMLVASGAQSLPVIGIIESPQGVLAAPEIARHPSIAALMTGSEDLALALGAVPDPDVLRFPKLLVHYAAKAAGKLSFGLFRSIADYTDLAGITEAAVEARRHGFDGATCIHPSAVAILNDAFQPSESELAWARRVLESEATRSLDGRMIDAPVIRRARALLDRS